jgi:two-component system chemotaxis response regulator CheB
MVTTTSAVATGEATATRVRDLDIVVIGASAGGVEALTSVVSSLPADFIGAVFVALHLPSDARSALAAILGRAGPLRAQQAEEGSIIQPGHIYVAPPGHNHLIVGHGRMHLVFGPKENHVRPAADPLFRSAARAYGPRVIGVVLSGTGADGTEGLRAIKAHGGIAIVQDPGEAGFVGMPRYAIRCDYVDHVVPVAQIGALLERLVHDRADPPDVARAAVDCPGVDAELEATQHDLARLPVRQLEGVGSGYLCPDCAGPLWEASDGAGRWLTCRVGHQWSGLASLTDAQAERLEDLAWGLVNALAERALLLRHLTGEDTAETAGTVGEVTAKVKELDRLVQVIQAALPRLL